MRDLPINQPKKGRHCSFAALIFGLFVVSWLAACSGGGGGGSEAPANSPSGTNSAPLAVAGSNQSVFTDVQVALDGSASSDQDGNPLSYSWSLTSKPAGSSASIVNASSVNASLAPDVDGNYTVRLVVSDGTVDSAASTMVVTAATGNRSPVANAGLDQSVSTGVQVVLNGSGSSDPDGSLLTYAWSLTSKPAGSTAAISNATSATAYLTPDVAGSYTVRLIVNDGTVASVADSMVVTAATGNRAPVANAGADKSVSTGVQVVLSGIGSSDPDGNPLTYAWSLTSKPAGSTATISSATSVTAYVTPDVVGSYTVRLIVSDGTVASAADSMVITASAVVAKRRLPDTGQTQSYTDTFGEDHDYTINPPSYMVNGNGTVTDNVTDLMWQREDDNTDYYWEQASGVADAEYNPGGTIDVCGNLTLAGYTDWRLPSKKELEGIRLFRGLSMSPFIDDAVFPDTNSNYYWSSITGAGGTVQGRQVEFGGSGRSQVRCVRGRQWPTNDFTVNPGGTVTDNITGLVWQQQDDNNDSWVNAIAYCEGLTLAGQTDWRLPNMKELESITDDSRINPAIDPAVFPNTKSDSYWSSTQHFVAAGCAATVNFSSGADSYQGRGYGFETRCVRGGQ